MTSTLPTRKAKNDVYTNPGETTLNARNVQFDFSDTPWPWVPEEHFASNVINYLNVLLPPGEEWFVEVFNKALPYINDEKILEEARGFIGQENLHAESHHKAFEDYMTRHGVDIKLAQEHMEYLFENMRSYPTDNEEKYRRHVYEQMWIIAACEHFTAVLGDFILNSSHDKYNADKKMLELFQWHGAEEVEHRMTAYRVAMYLKPGYIMRARAMAIFVPIFISYSYRMVKAVYGQDPNMKRKMNVFTFLGKYMKASRKGILPKIRTLLLSVVKYYLPGYSPNHVGNTAQAVAVLSRLEAVQKGNNL